MKENLSNVKLSLQFIPRFSFWEKCSYCIYIKNSDRQACANIVDPDQTPHYAASDQIYIVYYLNSV